MSETTAGYRYGADYTVGSEYPRQGAREFFLAAALKPARLIPPVLIIAAAVALGLAVGGIWWLVAFGGVVGFIISIPVAIRRTRKRFEVIVAAGGHFAVKLEGDSLTVTTPLATSQVSYYVYESVSERGSIVLLKQRASRIYTVLPAQLFTPESLDWLRRKIIDPMQTP